MTDPITHLSRLVKVPGTTGDEIAVIRAAAELGRELGLNPAMSADGVWFTEKGPEPGPAFLLTSHLDTVPAGNGWTCDPYAGTVETTGSEVVCRGRGAVDARGSCVAMMLALAGMKREGIRSGSVTAALSIGEEGDDPSLPRLLDRLGPVDAAVVGEPTMMDIAVSQRGLLVARLSAAGEQGHAARCTGTNSIQSLASDIVSLAAARLPAGMRVTPTRLAAGVADNVTPPIAMAVLDVRIPPTMTTGEAIAAVRAIVASDLEILADQWIPCMTPLDHPLVVAAARAMPGANCYDSDAASDWVFLQKIGVPALKIGPGAPSRSHQPDEWISASELYAGISGYMRIARGVLAG